MEKFYTPLKENLIFDVGMHKGEDTEYYLGKGFKVVGIEANPELVDYCKNKFARPVLQNKLTIIDGAITDNPQLDGRAKFFVNLDNSVWGTVLESWVTRNVNYGTQSKPIDVKAIDFVDCLKTFGIPYYLKIDIEGMDNFCLSQLEKFKKKPRFVSLELDINSIFIAHEQIKLLSELGYNKFQFINQADICNYKEPLHNGENIYKNHGFEFGSSGLFGKDLPPKWKNKYIIRINLLFIFITYYLFKKNIFWSDFILIKYLKKVILFYFKTNLPGWHDLHAFQGNKKI